MPINSAYILAGINGAGQSTRLPSRAALAARQLLRRAEGLEGVQRLLLRGPVVDVAPLLDAPVARRQVLGRAA